MENRGKFVGDAGKKTLTLIFPDFSNAHLTKDIGIIPYVMQKYHNYYSTIVCYKNGDYPDLDKYLKGIRLNFLDRTGNLQVDLDNYLENHSSIDLLFLCGLYDFNFKVIEKYRELNPGGKIYLKLDANIFWINRLELSDNIINILNKCDVISVECKKLHQYLNKKWPLTVEYLTNGYYNFYESDELLYSEKENVILTVGRIGTWQKANEILLEAFKKASGLIPDWKLKIVGVVEESFGPYIEEFYAGNAELKNRVIFTGQITDKELLEAEYKKAKIFCLTSRVEGFPNVFPEAARNGCYIISSNIEPAWDITNNGTLGEIFQIDNVPQLSEILVSVCTNEEKLRNNFAEIKEHAYDNFNWVKICKKIDILINN